MYSAVKNPSGAYDVFQNGTKISTGSSAVLPNYGLSETQLSTPKPAPATSTEPPPRNDQQSNPSGYNGTPDAPTNTDAGLAKATAGAPAIPTRNSGESASDFATRLLNSPFFLAGGNTGDTAYVLDPKTGQYVSKPNSSLNRPITSAPKQNSLGGGVGSGSGSVSSDALIGGETDAEKQAREYLAKFQTPETEADILARKTAQASDRINANKDYYASLLTGVNETNDLRTRETNASSVLNGLQGSSEAGNRAIVTDTKNKSEVAKVQAEQNVALQNIYKDIQDSAYNEAKQQKSDATTSATAILDRAEKNKTKAVTDITTLAKSGFDFDSIKASDPVTYKHLVDSVGGEAQFQAIAVLNRPQDTIVDKQLQNGKYTIVYRNPITGKTRIESTDLGLPPQYTKTIEAGDRVIAIPDNWNGTTVAQGTTPQEGQGIVITKGLAPSSSGTTVSGGLRYTAQDAQEDSKALEGSRGGDGFVDPAIYQKLYQAWVDHGGLLKDFLTKYPPKDYVNPANTDLPTYLRPKTTNQDNPYAG